MAFTRFVFTPSYQHKITFKMIFSDIPVDLVSINKDRAVKVYTASDPRGIRQRAERNVIVGTLVEVLFKHS